MYAFLTDLNTTTSKTVLGRYGDLWSQIISRMIHLIFLIEILVPQPQLKELKHAALLSTNERLYIP